jgi:hypothetical protein
LTEFGQEVLNKINALWLYINLIITVYDALNGEIIYLCRKSIYF